MDGEQEACVGTEGQDIARRDAVGSTAPESGAEAVRRDKGYLRAIGSDPGTPSRTKQRRNYRHKKQSSTRRADSISSDQCSVASLPAVIDLRPPSLSAALEECLQPYPAQGTKQSPRFTRKVVCGAVLAQENKEVVSAQKTVSSSGSALIGTKPRSSNTKEMRGARVRARSRSVQACSDVGSCGSRASMSTSSFVDDQ